MPSPVPVASISEQSTGASKPARWVVAFLLLIQTGLLAYSATQHSPTHLEPAFLASGISHWEFGRFELYRVNPPLPRMLAAFPLRFLDHQTDWSSFHDEPGSRAEFAVGNDFLKANGPVAIPLFFYARWACIPFSLLGAYTAYLWASELYGPASGFVALILFVFEPNLLAHGELITPDAACTAFGILAGFTFWRWLKRPSWTTALLAGIGLGLAELAKLSWLILFGLWPGLWLTWRWSQRFVRRYDSPRSSCNLAASASSTNLSISDGASELSHSRSSNPPLRQMVAILTLALYLINLGYAFDGFGIPLKEYHFVSATLSGQAISRTPNNRFRDSWLGKLPLPFPKQYVLGLDSQKKDLENFGLKSYLRGEWKQGGWWYYYVYGLLVKIPCGTWGLLALVLAGRCAFRPSVVHIRDELVLLCPAIILLLVVSSQTEFNIHLRYVFPALALFLVFIGQAGSLFLSKSRLAKALAGVLLAYAVVSTLAAYPNHFAYFNDFAGGTENGHKHLLGSSYDWGQNWLKIVKNLRKGESVSTIPISPTDYSLIFPALKNTSIDELPSLGKNNVAIVPWTEAVADSLKSTRLEVVSHKMTLIEVRGVSH